MGEEKEAQRIFSIENKGKPNLEELKREFELNTGWIKFYERLEFENAINNLINGNIDPRELLITFGYHGYISMLKDCLIKLPKTSIIDWINNYVIANKKRVDEKETMKNAKESLLSIAMNIHRELSHFDSDRIIKFSLCSYSENYKNFKDDRREISVEEMLKILTTSIMFILADLDYFVEFETFIKKSNNYYEDEVFLYLNRMDNKVSLAIFHENIGEIKEALSIWKNLKGDRGINNTLRILLKSNISKADFLFFAKWVIIEKPEKIADLFLNNENQVIIPEEAIDFIRNIQEVDLSSYVMKYLKELIEQKPDSPISLHNILANEYANTIFQLKPIRKSYTDKSENDELLKRYREDFRNFLNTSKKYDPNVVLKKLDGSWMMEEIILLLINTGQHEKALETYLDRNMDEEAEEFWTQMAPEKKVLTSLFEIYMKRYKFFSEEWIKASSQGQGVAKFSKFKEEKQKCESFAMKILKKYGNHSALDSTRVLKAIPDDYNLFDSRNGMMKFLTSMLDHKLTTKINNSIGEKLCSKEHKKVEYNLSMKKKHMLR